MARTRTHIEFQDKYGIQHFSLTPDGTSIAVGDRNSIVVVDVASGEYERFPVHVQDRGARTERPILLDVRDGSTTRVSYSIFGSDFAADGTPVELAVRMRPNGIRPDPRGLAALRRYSRPREHTATTIKTRGIGESTSLRLATGHRSRETATASRGRPLRWGVAGGTVNG